MSYLQKVVFYLFFILPTVFLSNLAANICIPPIAYTTHEYWYISSDYLLFSSSCTSKIGI